MAEFERDLIRDRTKAGLQAARLRGRKGGRKPLLNKQQVERMMALYQQQENTVTEICKIFSISRPSFYNYLRIWKQGGNA